MSVPLVPWFVGSGTSAPLVPWFVGVWYEYTTCTMDCGGLVLVHHLYQGLWGPGTSAPLVPGFVGAGTSVPLVPWFVGVWYDK